MKTQISSATIKNIDESIFDYMVHSKKRIATKTLAINPIEFKQHIFKTMEDTGHLEIDAIPLIDEFVIKQFYDNGIKPYSIENLEYATNETGQSAIVVTYKVME